jgi:ABC-2 type transport system permease protein
MGFLMSRLSGDISDNIAYKIIQMTIMIPAVAILFCITLLSAAAIVYSFWLMLATLSFWFIRIENITMIFMSMYTAGRWPVGIYPTWLKWMLTLVVPIAFAVTVPAEAVSGRLNYGSLTGSILLALLLIFCSRRFWRFGVKHYAGASA